MSNLEVKSKYLGKTITTNEGYDVNIIRFYNNSNVLIQFEDKHIQKIHSQQIQTKRIRNKFKRSNCELGYMGDGKYRSKDENGKTVHSYRVWKNLIVKFAHSSLDEEFFICEDWLNYQNFAEWYEVNYYELDNEKTVLMTTVFDVNNNVFSPETCMFVPITIKNLFYKEKKENDLPYGVHLNPYSCIKPFRTIFKYHEIHSHLFNGEILRRETFENPEDAFVYFKKKKESYIKTIREFYKDKVPYKLYEILGTFEVSYEGMTYGKK